MLGKLETETRWQMKDAARRTRQALTDAASRLQKERDDDWSNLDSKELLKKLVEKNVISIKGDELLDTSTKEAFGDLCKQYFLQIEEQKKVESEVQATQVEVVDVEATAKQSSPPSSPTSPTSTSPPSSNENDSNQGAGEGGDKQTTSA